MRGKLSRISYELGVMMYNAFTLREIEGYAFSRNFFRLGKDLLDIVIESDLREGFMGEALRYGVYEGKADDLFKEYYTELKNRGLWD